MSTHPSPPGGARAVSFPAGQHIHFQILVGDVVFTDIDLIVLAVDGDDPCLALFFARISFLQLPADLRGARGHRGMGARGNTDQDFTRAFAKLGPLKTIREFFGDEAGGEIAAAGTRGWLITAFKNRMFC